MWRPSAKRGSFSPVKLDTMRPRVCEKPAAKAARPPAAMISRRSIFMMFLLGRPCSGGSLVGGTGRETIERQQGGDEDEEEDPQPGGADDAHQAFGAERQRVGVVAGAGLGHFLATDE